MGGFIRPMRGPGGFGRGLEGQDNTVFDIYDINQIPHKVS
jgi:hypothetical protein